MFEQQIDKINRDIDKTGKAIIGLGCSFVQGQGAFDEDIVKQYGTNFSELGDPLKLQSISDNEKNELIKKYPLVKFKNNKELDFTFMEYQNAFTNVLCEKYFEGKYASINLGLRGCGNRGTIKELYFYPEINWHKLKEIIVIYCPSGTERFDFINDQFLDHGHWVCMWPHYNDKTGPRQTLWKGYNDCLYSDKFEILEQIAHVQELLTWCKLFNAKLIVVPSFDRKYDREFFINAISSEITRNIDGILISQKENNFIKKLLSNKKVEQIVDLFPWKHLFEPDGSKTFADMAIKQEFPNTTNNKLPYFWDFIGKGTPNNWITPCAHPSAKAHDYFAKLLFEHITKEIL